MKQRYKVIDPKGVVTGGERKPEGTIIEADPKSAEVAAWLRFKQVEDAPEDTDPPAPADTGGEGDAGGNKTPDKKK